VEVCRAALDTGCGGRVGEECNCPQCHTEPAGDAFVDPCEINPRRRIVRAMRPPPGVVSSETNTSNSTGNGDNEAAASAVHALGSRRNNDGAGHDNVIRTSNAGGTGSHDTPSDISGALGFLHQLNNGTSPPGSGTNTNTVGSNSGATTPPNDATRPGNDTNVARVADLQEDLDYDEEDYNYDDDDEVELLEAEDSEDEDDGPMPSRFFQGFMNHMSEMARRNARRPRENLSSNIRPDDDDEDSDEEHEDSTTARCAACFCVDNQNHKWRRLVTLPCCGTNGRERNSSTRFCAGCILKLAVTRADSSNTSEYGLYDDEPDEYPARKFYQKSVQTENRRFCECPRCRDIILVKIKGVKPAYEDDSDDDDDEDSDESNDCDCSTCEAEREERNTKRKGAKTAKSVSVHVPSFKAKCWHIGRKRGIAKLLWKVALLHHNFMPYEALGGDEEQSTILRLTGYGIIEKVPGHKNKSLYRMDKQNQTKLIKFFRHKNPSEKDQKAECSLVTEMQTCMMFAAWRHLRDEYRIDRSLRMLNRFFFLGLLFFGYLPPLPLHWWQELVVTALILFAVALSAQFLCVLVVYALVFFGVGLSVCFVLRRSKSCWWQVILVSYFVYRLNVFFYANPYLSWSVLVAPKAMVPVKKMIWG